MSWLIGSIVLSVVLTVVLNLGVRAFPHATERAVRRAEEWPDDGRRVRVFFPWKAMLIASIVLTIVVNVFARRG
jgi:hypothetical protein